MSGGRLYLFDDARARSWAPFTLTRPAGELLLGCMSLRARAERVLGLSCAGHVTRPALEGFDEPDAPPVVSLEEVDGEGRRIFLSSRVALADQEAPGVEGPARLTVDGVCVGRVVPAGHPGPEGSWLLDPVARDAPGEEVALEGQLLEGPWSLEAHNADWIARDIPRLWLDDHEPAGVIRLGMGPLSMAADAEIEPGVVVDTRDGPVRLDRGVRVAGPARLTGPLWVGPGSTVLGGSVGTSSVGPVCKVRGELADSVLLGFVNKAHDGHLGHAVLGRWVNLGAGTINSDLKNNYGPVRVWTPDGDVDTGLVKVGCFLGDHVKTGIGTLLNTGAVVGAGSNLFGGAMPPTVVPPFSWGSGSDLTDFRLDKFLEVAERAMARRARDLTPGVRRILTRAWHDSRTSDTP